MSKEKVAAYIRVSTASTAQTHSFAYQESYWRDKLGADERLNLVGIYADIGISGRLMSRRPQFNAMLEDCRQGLINKIYVKSVSRFSRNTTELLDMVRQLREMNISVYFEQENIDTLKTTSDLVLSIAVCIAEADLARYSENQKWSAAYRFSQGILAVGNRIYGYELTKENDLIPIEKEAVVIRNIFSMYLQGKSVDEIAKTLTNTNIPTARGNQKWQGSTIKKILQNEKYNGDALLQKYVSLNGVKIQNTGAQYSKQYYIEGSHEAIIDKDTFAKARQMQEVRTIEKLKGQKNKVYEFTGNIICGECGKHFIHKINNAGTPWETAFWNCAVKIKEGKHACESNGIKDSVVKEKFIEVYNAFVEKGWDNDIVEKAKKKRKQLLSEESELTKMLALGFIKKEHCKEVLQELLLRIREQENIIQKYKIKNVTLKDFNPITEYSPIKFDKFIDVIKIQDWKITFRFINGIEITRPYTNGGHGNIQDWVKKTRRR